MTEESTDSLIVLHVIRVKGFVEEDGICEVTGLERSVVDAALVTHARNGLVTHRDGRFAGWSLSPAGRETHRTLLATDLAASGQRTAILAAYDQFLPINGEFKQICTDWQLRPVAGADPVPNDHSDDTYDKGVIGQLEEIHAGSAQALDVLEEVRRFVVSAPSRRSAWPSAGG